MHCQNCGARTSEGARFCAACGAALVVPPPASPGAPRPAPPPRPSPAPYGADAGPRFPEPPRYEPPRPEPPPYMPGFQEPRVGMGAPMFPGPRTLDPAVEHALSARYQGHLPQLSPAAWPGHGIYCSSCHQRTVPVPYFSRGFNLAKAGVLLAFSPIAPLLFFLVKRDRVLCGWCKASLPGEMSVPLLDSFSTAPMRLLEGGGEPGMVPSNDGSQHEIAVHERKSYMSRKRTRTLAVAALALGGVGGSMAVSNDFEPAALFISIGGLSGIGAVASQRRAQRHKLAAEAKRQRLRVLEILSLARAHAGRLSVTLVAAHMRCDLREAETLLDSMIDGRRVDVEVDKDGRMTYVFSELMPALPPTT